MGTVAEAGSEQEVTRRDTGRMAEVCGTTRGAGNNKAYEDAVNTRISGELQEVESDLPEDIRDRALSVFRAAISDKATVQQAIEKVQKEALVEVETRFKGQRFKGFIKFDYDTSVNMEMLSFLLEWELRRWFVQIHSWAGSVTQT